jgi:hypothetical protein
MNHSLALAQAVAGHAARFQTLLADPAKVQAGVLRSILQQNQNSAFGQQHRFADLLQADDASLAARYASLVPIARYEDLQAAIARIAAGEQQVLTEAPVIAFEETGGSSGGHKQIPYTLAGLAAFQQGLLPWLDDLFQHLPQLGRGRLYWAISPACRWPKTTAGGIPVGLPGDAAWFGPEVGMAVVNALAVSADVGQIRDPDEWRWHTLLQLLRCEDLTLISVWSPSFLSELLRHASLLGTELAQAIAQADAGADQVRNHHADSDEARQRANQARARLVAEVLAQAQPDYARLWPQLQVISCWDQATSAALANWLRSQFPGVRLQGKGLLATEAMISVPLCEQPLPVLALESGFFEFIDREDRVWLADELAVGQQYQVLLTTHSGLYRYAIGDWVRIGGLAQRTPMLEFIGRDQTGSDLCGEKLSDAFVAPRIAPFGKRFAMLVPMQAAAPLPSGLGRAAHYQLWLDQAETSPQAAEQLAQQLDRALHDNPQYAYARQIGQLAPVTPHCCEQPLARWLQWRLAQGQRLGDIKLPALLGIAAAGNWQSWHAPSGFTAS